MGKGRTGETVQDPGNGRAKNSARPRFGSFARPIRAGFELRRGVIPPKKTERPSILNEGFVIAAPRQRLKTGAEQRKEQQYHRRAEFFALPIVG
jgi:hypothetical protein